jgi:hypothetical protein
MVSVYWGTCPRCDEPRRFEFQVSGKVVAPPAFGGAEPSTIIDPGEFLTLSRRAAAAAPADPGGLPVDEVDGAYEAIALAVAALEEVLKFIPVAENGVPSHAFLSPAGRAMFQRKPHHFDREALEARIAVYRARRSTYERLALGS